MSCGVKPNLFKITSFHVIQWLFGGEIRGFPHLPKICSFWPPVAATHFRQIPQPRTCEPHPHSHGGRCLKKVQVLDAQRRAFQFSGTRVLRPRNGCKPFPIVQFCEPKNGVDQLLPVYFCCFAAFTGGQTVEEPPQRLCIEK